MWNFIIRNWLVGALGLVITVISTRYLYKHPRVRAFLQPAKEIQHLISERDDLLKQVDRLRTESDSSKALKEGLFDEVSILRVVRDKQRAQLDEAKAEAELVRRSLSKIRSELHDTET